MSKFITGKELENAIYDIIWDAEHTLLIVSPYVKLDDYFKKLFDKHKDNPKIHLLLVFGKNETAISKSLSKEDFDFFKKFPNVSIIYVPTLHAKYYGNEEKGIVTSINLYDYSFKNNIEFGIYSEQKIINTLTDRFTGNPDKEAWNKCIDIAKTNDTIFIKRPVYENKGFLGLGRKYLKSETLLDYTDHFYSKKATNYKARRLDEFDDELEMSSNYGTRPPREEVEDKKPEVKQNEYQAPKINYIKEQPQHGYCIRTGEQIPFNPAQPLSKAAWRTWNEFGNPDFPEKFCHKTGKPSYGKTSMRNPIL